MADSPVVVAGQSAGPKEKMGGSFWCPKCGTRTCVVDSRPAAGNQAIRRRRRCLSRACDHRFSTFESIDGSSYHGYRIASRNAVMLEDLLPKLEKMLADFRELRDLTDPESGKK